MPFAGYKDFEDCTKKQQEKGYDIETAKKICGKLQAELENKMKPIFEVNKYLPISKVDNEERIVYGYASTPDLDSQGEIVELNAIKEALPNYMKFPTIREMHTTNAVGRTKGANVDEKGLFISAKIVDDNAWKKVKEGVFNGFSIGGRVKQMVDNVIKSMDLTEISLVDVPANKNAVITLFKSDMKSQLQKDFENSLVKFSFDWREVEKLAEKKDKVIEEVVVEEHNESSEDIVENNEVENTQEVVEDEVIENTDTETEEVEEVETEDVEETEEVETEETEETPAVEVDEAKQVSDEPTDLQKSIDKINQLEDKYNQKIEKINTIEKMDKAITKIADLLVSIDERLSKVESTPAEPKTKATFLVEKGLGNVEVKKENLEVAKAQAELDELIKIRETNPDRYALENMSVRAFKLLDFIRNN